MKNTALVKTTSVATFAVRAGAALLGAALVLGVFGGAPLAASAFAVVHGAGNGMITIAAIAPVCTKIDSGTVYHCLLPTLMDGSTMSPNIFSARGTGLTPSSRTWFDSA